MLTHPRATLLSSLGIAALLGGSVFLGCGDSDSGPAAAKTSTGDASFDSATATDAGGEASTDGGDGGEGGTVSTAFKVETPEIDVAPGENKILCSYFKTPNPGYVSVKAWQSDYTPGIRHLALLFTATDRMPPGTLSAAGCGMVANDANPPTWAYSTWKRQDGWSFPADDGTGKPVGTPVKATQSGYLLVEVINTTAAPIKVRGSVAAVGYAAGTAITQAYPYVTYNGNINLPAAGTGSVTSTCATPVGAKFNWMSTLSRKLTTHTYLRDGAATVLLDSTDFDKPGARIETQAPFVAFGGNQAVLQCDYTNPGATAVTTGESVTDETCMMLGYHFPATKPRTCVNDVLLP